MSPPKKKIAERGRGGGFFTAKYVEGVQPQAVLCVVV